MNRVFILLLILNWTACVKDKPRPDSGALPNSTHHGWYLCNEGAYGNNNGDFSFLDLQTGQMYNNLYALTHMVALGDVVEDLLQANQEIILSVNHSNKLVFLDANDFHTKAEIYPLNSPRYILQVSADKAYVSSLYYPNIYVIDLHTHSLIKTLHTDYPNTEHMAYLDGWVYVCNWDTASSLLYRINPLTDAMESIPLGVKASHDIVLDQLHRLWILSGNTYAGITSHLTLFDPASLQIVRQWTFDSHMDPVRLYINPARNRIQIIAVNYNGTSDFNGLYQMGLNDSLLPDHAFLQAPDHSYFWALGTDSLNTHLFLADPKGFNQQSSIYEYDTNGSLHSVYRAGIGVNGFFSKP